MKLRLKSREMEPSSQVYFNVRRLWDKRVRSGVQKEIAESFGELDDSGDPEKLWTDFKTKILKVSESCLRGTLGTSKIFLT